MLDKSIREIERERQGLQAQEKKLIMEIKKSAKQGQMVCHSFLLLVCTPCFIGIASLVLFISIYVPVELLLILPYWSVKQMRNPNTARL